MVAAFLAPSSSQLTEPEAARWATILKPQSIFGPKCGSAPTSESM